MTLGELLKQYRKAKDLSQRDFARQCGLSHSLVSILEMGINPQTGKKPEPDLGTYKKLAIGMNRSVQDLFNDLGNSESVRLFAVDSVPVKAEVKDKELEALLKLWKVATPERKKAIIRVIKAMSEDDI